jgi:putative transposase
VINIGGNGVSDRKTTSVHERWAHLRHSVVGGLLTSPPEPGELQARINELAAREWMHPVSAKRVRFGASTIQRWYYIALAERHDPVGVLRRKVRCDLGTQGSVSDAVQMVMREQYAKYPDWSVQLHYDNLVAAAQTRPELNPVPSYSTLRRFCKAQGLRKRRRLSSNRTEGVERAEERLEKREVRSWEADHVNAVWQWDGHRGSLPVLTESGEYKKPILIGIRDNRSRLICHAQWYHGAERAQITAHAWSQAIMKRNLPRSNYHDNGSAMIAEEIQDGFLRLGVSDARTMTRSPYMNGQIERFWPVVEGQLLAMLGNVKELTLDALNEATQAWCDTYNRTKHSVTRQTPLERFLAGPNVQRPSPDRETLRLAFTRAQWRTQRMSDGSIALEGQRFELHNRWRHMPQVLLRYASWDLKYVWLIDDRTGQVVDRLFPQDKSANASGVRRPLEPVAKRRGGSLLADKDVPPLLARALARQAATGLPPPYLPLDEGGGDSSKDSSHDANDVNNDSEDTP